MIDATSNLDRQDSKYFRFVTPTSVGGLPLGFCVVSSERTDVLTEAFSMFKEILPDYAFYKRGKELGPCLVMTDDAESEITAIR